MNVYTVNIDCDDYIFCGKTVADVCESAWRYRARQHSDRFAEMPSWKIKAERAEFFGSLLLSVNLIGELANPQDALG